MAQLYDQLDLSIILTTPPLGSSSDVIASITLSCSQLGLSHTGDLLADPLTRNERGLLRWYLEEYWKLPYYGFNQRGKQVEALLPEVGKRLYMAVFGSVKADRIVQKWLSQSEKQLQISIVSDLPMALSLPWELLHSEQGFLVLRTQHPVSIVRRLPQSELTEISTTIKLPLRVLLVTARPEGAGFVDPRGVARELLNEVQEYRENGTIAVEFLRPPTLPALRKRLSDSKHPIHVLHFDGHGTFESKAPAQDGLCFNGGGQGMLAFEDDEGGLNLVKAEDVAQVLLNSGVRLAVLNACQSAMSTTDDAFSSVAAKLIQSGVDAVVAMSASVLVASATRYSAAFYRELAAGTPAPTAQERARQALYDNPHRHQQRRRGDEESTIVELRDWWLPHFYQQRPLKLHPTRAKRASKKQTRTTMPRLNEEMPFKPRYQFSGRARELLQIERHLLHGRLVVIYGFGGIGKTALSREAADWLTKTDMYVGACFISFEHSGDATMLLSALGNYLGVYDANYHPNDVQLALARLKPVLKEKPILVIADNIESILPNGEAPLQGAARSQLWNTLMELVHMGTGVLPTTRDRALGDGWTMSGNEVAHVELRGLHPDDAYALAVHVLKGLGINYKRIPYAELRDLLVQLDHHPLAIQLVLPALREFPLAKIKADFAVLLGKFADDTEAGRNKSLAASLEYSLQRLGEEQRAHLSRLIFFEGGASEDNLLAITNISETGWTKLRSALEESSLLTAEHNHGIVGPSFLHFHPVLIPYLRNRLGMSDAELREQYIRRYVALARDLYYEDNHNTKLARLLARRELPNLRRTFNMLLEDGKLEVASAIASCIDKFLTVFGLTWELNELHRQMAGTITAPHAHGGKTLTPVEYLYEIALGEKELGKGDLKAAHARFATLLASMETLPEGTLLSRGSCEYCLTLGRLARCFRQEGQPDIADDLLREALVLIEKLIIQQPNQPNFICQRGILLTDLGTTLRDRGEYLQAQKVYEEALKIAQQQGNQRPQAVVLGELGTLALMQQDYARARSHQMAVRKIFGSLDEPEMEAVAWHQLGNIALQQHDLPEAERCYRESLRLEEQLGNVAGAANSCSHLAIVAEGAGRPTEAEEWYIRALELNEQIHPGSDSYVKAGYLNNLASLLLNEVRAGRFSAIRLTEARTYAEQALAIDETLGNLAGTWTPLSILAQIADLEGRREAARNYRHRELEAFAAFAGNRYHIDHHFGQLIDNIIAACGDMSMREKIEATLSQFKAYGGWHLTTPIQRIWAGERDWHNLTEDVDRRSALFVLRVLESLAQTTEI